MQRRERHDPRVQPGIADVRDAPDRLATARAANGHLIDIRPVRGMPVEPIPTVERPLLEVGEPADYVERAAALAVVDREREAPIALLADHPVVHVQEPIEL